METLSIESPKPFPLDKIVPILSMHWEIQTSAGGTLTIHDGKSRAYLHLDTEMQQPGLSRLLIDYSDIGLVKGVLCEIADDAAFVIDNDFGTVLSGADFVARLRAETDWDWRR